MDKIYIPMNANPIANKWDKVIQEGYWVQEKFMGERAVIQCNGILTTITSRGGKEKGARVPHILKYFSQEHLKGYIFDCEIYRRGWDDATICGLLNPNSTYLTEENFELIAYIFDILRHPITGDMTSLPLKTRSRVLETFKLEKFIDKLSSMQCSIACFPPLLKLSEEETLIFYNQIIDRGGEGIMFKNPNSEYKEGKRPTNHWYKMKKQESWDVVITGFTEGKGKYEGQIGAIEFGLYFNGTLTTIGRTSGMTDSLRKRISMDKGEYMWKVIEVEGLHMTENYAIENPRFKRFRNDKKKEECIYEPLSV